MGYSSVASSSNARSSRIRFKDVVDEEPSSINSRTSNKADKSDSRGLRGRILGKFLRTQHQCDIDDDGPSITSNSINNYSESGVSVASSSGYNNKRPAAGTVSTGSLVLGLLDLEGQSSAGSCGSEMNSSRDAGLLGMSLRQLDLGVVTNGQGIAQDQSSSGCFSGDLASEMAALIIQGTRT